MPVRNVLPLALLILAGLQAWSQATPPTSTTTASATAAPQAEPCTSGDKDVLLLTPMSKDQSKQLRKKYLPAVIKETFDTWLKYIPEKAKAPLLTKGCVAISFTITRPGKVSMMKLDHPSGDRPLDLAAWGSISTSTYLPLPNDYPNDQLRLRLHFLYNEKLGKSPGISIQSP